MRLFLAPHRCPGCEIRKPLCFCLLIPKIALQTRVMILMHTSEEVLTTNTARLASKCLTNSEVRIHGRRDERMITSDFIQPERTSLLLYPSPISVELTPEFASKIELPVHLIVPDANWRQTTKFVRHDPSLKGIQHVKLPLGAPSEYLLRTQRDVRHVCTLEAIARAIGILESPAAQASLETILCIQVERTLWSRGRLAASECTTAGIPVEAQSG